MVQIVGIFCGTSARLQRKPDALYGPIEKMDRSFEFLADDMRKLEGLTVHSYDGVQTEHHPLSVGGLYAHGTDGIADKFVAEVAKIAKTNPDEEIKINMIAHSRGCISVLKAVKKIQADPELCKRVKVVLDLRDPVPGNLPVTVDLGIPSAVGVELIDMSKCKIISKASVIFTAQGVSLPGASDLGYRPILPKFPPACKVEIEILNAKHSDLQIERKFQSPEARIANLKSMQLVAEHADNPQKNYITGLKKLQQAIYNEMLRNLPHKTRVRKMHYGGEIHSVGYDSEIVAVNTRHLKLRRELEGLDPALNRVAFIFESPKDQKDYISKKRNIAFLIILTAAALAAITGNVALATFIGLAAMTLFIANNADNQKLAPSF